MIWSREQQVQRDPTSVKDKGKACVCARVCGYVHAPDVCVCKLAWVKQRGCKDRPPRGILERGTEEDSRFLLYRFLLEFSASEHGRLLQTKKSKTKFHLEKSTVEVGGCIFRTVLFLLISHDYVKLLPCFISQAAALGCFWAGSEPPGGGCSPSCPSFALCMTFTLRCPCTSAERAPMRRERPRAVAFLSDSAGHRFGRARPACVLLGHA